MLSSILSKPPFSLSQNDIDWVESRWDALDDTGRIAQLFCLISTGHDAEERTRLKTIRPGGVTRFFGADTGWDVEAGAIRDFQEDAEVPLLVTSDLEGARMSLPFGIHFPNALATAAIDDPDLTAELARHTAEEARALGINWHFGPVLDINATPRSPIVATRSFGSDIDRISEQGLAQIRAFQDSGLAATAKHWPGEGYDDRDQHLLTTINPLSIDVWHETFGRLYREAIEAGVMAVMSAHIAWPSYARAAGVEEGVELYRPASVSPVLNQKLLREEMGFNGVIVSDASEMAGLTAFMDRVEAKIEILTSGADMVLFSGDPEGEIEAIRGALHAGRLSEDRLKEAFARVVGMKAALGLHQPEAPRTRPDSAPIQKKINAALRRAPVVEKDVNALLPISPAQHKRITVVSHGIIEPIWNSTLPVIFPDLLRAEGFEVTLCQPGDPIDSTTTDLLIYCLAEETLATRGRIFLDWSKIGGGLRGAMRRPWHEVPTLMIAFGYPYYLYDAPRVPCYINAWTTMDEMQEAVVDLILGRCEAEGHSPIDAFAGAPDAKY